MLAALTDRVTHVFAPKPAPNAPPLEPGTIWKEKTLTELVDILNAFPTADAIAHFLLHEGVRGVCGSASKCAIAQWIEDEAGDSYRDIGVSGGHVCGRRKSDHVREIHPCSAAVGMFVAKFDIHRYPDLMRADY